MLSYIFKMYIFTIYATRIVLHLRIQVSKKKFHYSFFEYFLLLFSSALDTSMKWCTKYTGCDVQLFKTSQGKDILILTRHKVLSSCTSVTKGPETPLSPCAFLCIELQLSSLLIVLGNFLCLYCQTSSK